MLYKGGNAYGIVIVDAALFDNGLISIILLFTNCIDFLYSIGNIFGGDGGNFVPRM